MGYQEGSPVLHADVEDEVKFRYQLQGKRIGDGQTLPRIYTLKMQIIHVLYRNITTFSVVIAILNGCLEVQAIVASKTECVIDFAKL